MNKMVMIIPIDCQIDEAQYVADEIRSHASEDLPTGAVRHLQLEDHDRDDDGDHAVAESCETIFSHGCELTSYHIVVVKAELCITAKLAADVRDGSYDRDARPMPASRRLVVLGVPGQGARRCGLSLNPRHDVGCGRRKLRMARQDF